MLNFDDYTRAIDDRGKLFAFNKLQQFDIKRVYLIEPEKNIWRGKHFHKECTQIVLVFNGELFCKVINENTKEVNEFVMPAGTSFCQTPGLAFCFKANLEDTKILVLSNREFDKNDYYEVSLGV
jgi:hypothetical protein